MFAIVAYRSTTHGFLSLLVFPREVLYTGSPYIAPPDPRNGDREAVLQGFHSTVFLVAAVGLTGVWVAVFWSSPVAG